MIVSKITITRAKARVFILLKLRKDFLLYSQKFYLCVIFKLCYITLHSAHAHTVPIRVANSDTGIA